jgi:acyl carrier protein
VADAEALHQEIKALIVDTLMLEEVTADEIDTDAPLFVEGLGLDSIDSLELAMELEERYGVTLEEDPEQNQAIFQSVRSLASFVLESRQV